jgi:hypothetical protein
MVCVASPSCKLGKTGIQRVGGYYGGCGVRADAEAARSAFLAKLGVASSACQAKTFMSGTGQPAVCYTCEVEDTAAPGVMTSGTVKISAAFCFCAGELCDADLLPRVMQQPLLTWTVDDAYDDYSFELLEPRLLRAYNFRGQHGERLEHVGIHHRGPPRERCLRHQQQGFKGRAIRFHLDR